ncbi:hypothetical protein [Pedobacter sp. SG908]|uniref:hypothetical protein n=1 Tax=Pedobacter sp. SG908 TaxID=2587135 RepID=UPI00141FA093|nr:hypothetical protein [Pedobacter sp. SG908]NII83173.1 hypothetical protein [Pedobacter sp. SG908]
MTAKIYQNELFPKMERVFAELEVKNEWAAFSGRIHQYSPRIDLAIGPFNVEGPNLNHIYDELVEDEHIRHFLLLCFKYHKENLNAQVYDEIIHPEFETIIHKNKNARCFIAIEIENQNSKKHIMGSVVNAASLGRVGIGVAFNESTLRSFCRIANYLAFLKRVEKNTYDTYNFMILTVDQLESIYQDVVHKFPESILANRVE